MPAPIIANSKTTTETKYGGDALNNVNNYLNGIDVTSQIGTPIIRTPTKFPSDKLIFTDPAEDNTVTVKIPALSANKNINLIPSNVTDNDEVLYKDSVQTITGKVISASSNTIQNIDTTNLAASADIITTTNTKTLTNKTLTAPVISTISNTGTLTLPTTTTTIIGRDTTDTLTNKTFDADGTGNSITNIENADIKTSAGIVTSKLADSANFAFKNSSNTFAAAPQTITANSTNLFQLYRTLNTNLTGTGMTFDLQNSSSAQKSYAAVYGVITSNTAGSEQGAISFQVANAGALREVLGMTTAGELYIGPSATRATFKITNLTSTRNLELPNISGNLMTQNSTDTTSNKTFDAKTNTFVDVVVASDLQKYGAYSCSDFEVDGYGLLRGLQGYGTLTLNEDNNGCAHIWSTGTTTSSVAGVVVHKNSSHGLTRRILSPRLKTRCFVYPKSSTDSRCYIGFTGVSSLLPQSDTPISTSQNGFLIGWRSSDTNFQVFHNDAGGGAMTVVDTGVTLPVALTIYTFEISMNSSNVVWTIYNSSGTSLASGTISSLIPSTSANLWLQAITQNTTTTSKNIGFLAMSLWSAK